MLRLVAYLSLVACAGPAAACLNDNELPNHEREFRSQYRGQARATPSPPAPDHRPLYAAGALMLVGAFALVGRRAGG